MLREDYLKKQIFLSDRLMYRSTLQKNRLYRIAFLHFLVLFFTSSSVGAEPIQSKDWVWSMDNNEFFYAGTTNNSQHFFGQFCYFETEDCIYLLSVKVTCETEAEMPALVNSDKGAIHVSLICGHMYEGYNVLYMTPFDDVDLIVRQSSYLRIAIPMESDQFKVSRFSLIGSTSAVDNMRAATETAIEILRTNKTQDEEYL